MSCFITPNILEHPGFATNHMGLLSLEWPIEINEQTPGLCTEGTASTRKSFRMPEFKRLPHLKLDKTVPFPTQFLANPH